jgi:hypothetical protein
VALFAVVSLESPLAAQVYDDGGIHSIEGTAPDTVVVKDGPSSNPTTVLVGPASDVPYLNAFESSVLRVSGGSISHATIHDAVQTIIEGGNISSLTAYDSARILIDRHDSVVSHVETHDTATAVVLGGDISHLRAYDGSRITVDGVFSAGDGTNVTSMGFTESWPAGQPSQVDVLGGTYQAAHSDAGGVTNLYGGAFLAATASHSGVVNVFGGDIAGSLEVVQASVNVIGGKVSSIFAAEGFVGIWGGQIGEIRDHPGGLPQAGDVHVYGLSLQYSGVSGDRLTGVLSDGTAIDAPVSLERNRLHLHVVPEPEAATLALLAVTFAVMWRRRCSPRAIQAGLLSTVGGAAVSAHTSSGIGR